MIASIFFYIFFIVYTATVKVNQLDSVSIGIETIIVLIFSFYLFYELLNEPKVIFINNDYRFWIILGMVIYLAGTFFIYIYANTVTIRELVKFLFLTYVFYIIKDIFFVIGIIVHSKKQLNTAKSNTIPFLDMEFNHGSNH